MAAIDERLTNVNNERDEALNEVDQTYGNMISQSDKYFQEQANAVDKWGKEQTNLQNQQTDFAIDKIEQQKEWAEKDYTKEQSGAYTDWQKQSNQYGVNAEQMAAQGMANTGYSESAQVSMYNQYQNRVAMARESFVRAQAEFNNAITEARLQNNAALAKIAAETLQKKLELSLQGFQYKNQLITEKAEAKRKVSSDYWGRYTDVLDQINTENALAETKRHNEASEAATKAQLEIQRAAQALNEKKFEWQKAQAGGSSSGGSSGGSGKINKGSSKPKTSSKNKSEIVATSGSGVKTGTSGNTTSKSSRSKADNLEKKKYSERSWTLVDDGGTNWFWGVDGNAKYKDQYGNTVSGDKLVDTLVDEGMSKKNAKGYVKALQKALGAG